MYCLDTNIFLDWWERRYPSNVFPSVEVAMNRAATDGLIIAPERVRDEIQRVGSPELNAWAKANRSLFLPHDAALQTQANEIQRLYPGLIDTTTVHDEADRYIIALAKLRDFAVVTHETSAKSKKRPPRSHYIPDVCAAMNIRCRSLVEMMREQGWKF